MQPLKVLVVDDEVMARENLQMLLEQFCPNVTVVGVARHAKHAMQLVRTRQPDVVFLDINMPKMDGFEFLESIGEVNFSVIFTTAHSEHALKAYKANALDYLEKPIDIDELIASVAKARRAILGKNSKVTPYLENFLERVHAMDQVDKTTIPTAEGFRVVPNREIIYLEANESYTDIYLTENRKITASRNIKIFEEKLNSSMFFRAHRSYIINLRYHLSGLLNGDSNIATMSNGKEIPIARRKYQEFLDRTENWQLVE